MVKLINEDLTDRFNGHTVKSYGYKDIDKICLLVDDEPYLIADMKNGNLRVFVDWVNRMDIFNGKKIIKGKTDASWMLPSEIYLETTDDEATLIRLLRKLTKYPNGRVIL